MYLNFTFTQLSNMIPIFKKCQFIISYHTANLLLFVQNDSDWAEKSHRSCGLKWYCFVWRQQCQRHGVRSRESMDIDDITSSVQATYVHTEA